MKLVKSKEYSVNGRAITLERYEGKRRSHGKWVPCKTTYTTIEGLKNVEFFLYNDYGDYGVSFSLETLDEDERKVIANGNEELLAIEDDGKLICESGIIRDLEVVYSDWYGIEL